MDLNYFEMGLSFLEGLALIGSPCILPVLPLVLVGSLEGGRGRPFGIILGFMGAFTVFALLSRQLVSIFHINLDYLQYTSLILLALFGFILLSEKLSLKFSILTQSIAHIGSSLSVHAKSGFGGGLFIGILIGLIWTPCAGPILAAALVQVIRQNSDLQACLLIASFAIGAGLPMLAISLLSKSIMDQIRFLTAHAEAVRKTFGFIVLLAVAFIASGIKIQSWDEVKEKPIMSTQTGLINALVKPYPAPAFSGISTWLNSEPLTIKSLRGKVLLVDFWTYSCINCIRTLPFITHLDQKYRDKGLVIIGVHAPEFEFEKNRSNVENAIAQHQISYPVALDNDLNTWSNFNNHYWPAHYLIDRDGRVVYTHFGEGEENITEHNIRSLLGLDPVKILPESAMVQNAQTPETYLGSARSSNFSTSFTSLPPDHWALSGKWRVEDQYIIAESTGAKLKLNFTAGKVFLVMGAPKGKSVEVNITLNGKPAAKLTVKQHTLYLLIDQKRAKQGILEITAMRPGLEAYAFTFGQ